jgi:hypothetical protein
MTVLVMSLVVLFCILLSPTRRFSNWLNAQEGSDGLADGTNAPDASDTDSLVALDSSAEESPDAGARGGANAISPFDGPSTGTDHLFGLEGASDADGGPSFGGFLAGTPLSSGLSFDSTPVLDALNAGADFGAGPGSGAFGGGGFGGGASASGALGSGAFGGTQAGGATLGALSAGGGATVGNGGSGSVSGSGGAAGSGGNGGGNGNGGNGGGNGNGAGNGNGGGNGRGNDGSGSGDQGNAAGSGGQGGSGGGNDDGVIFIANQGDPGPTGPDGVNVSVYPSGPDGSTILSDPDDGKPGTGPFPGGVSISAVTDPTPVPEPATLLLLGSGLVGISYRFKRRS